MCEGEGFDRVWWATVQFVSSFTDNNLSGEQLAKAYLRLNRSQAAQDDAGLQPSLQNAADGAAFDEVCRPCPIATDWAAACALHTPLSICLCQRRHHSSGRLCSCTRLSYNQAQSR